MRDLTKLAERYKQFYKKGDRVELIDMDEPGMPSGLKGTVRFVDDIATIHVEWDNGRTLGVTTIDSCRKI